MDVLGKFVDVMDKKGSTSYLLFVQQSVKPREIDPFVNMLTRSLSVDYSTLLFHLSLFSSIS